MSNEYNYDDQAQFFPFFFLTVSGLITLPLTYNLLQRPSDADAVSSKRQKITSPFTPEHVDVIDGQRAKQKRKELRLKRMITAGIGWALMAYMVYLMVVVQRATPKVWNPYDILDIAMSASERDINSRYRRLSITMHPDKRQPDPNKNETIESVNNEWVEIVKAFKALTDEEVRNNYINYGNPDGKQSTSFGIALPQFLVAEGSGKYILLMYGVLLGIGLPLLVGKWWYGMQKMTREKVLVTTAAKMFKEYTERMDEGDVVAAISTANEFDEVLSGVSADAGLSTVEKKLLDAGDLVTGMLPKDRKKLEDVVDPAQRKALALLWAYVSRQDLSNDKSLENEKYEVAPTAVKVNEAFSTTCLAYGFTAPLLASYHVGQSLIQAVPPSASARLPLLQLPHFTRDMVREIELSTALTTKRHLNVQSFMALPTEQRQALAEAAGLTNDRLKQAEHVARQLPRMQVEKAWFKVQGEKYIIPSSLVQFVVKARFIPPGTANVPPVKEEDLLDIDPAEGDLKAQKIEPEQHPLPLAYAPYLPLDKAPKWHVFLADNRQGKVAVPPFTFQNFDKIAFEEKDGGIVPTFNVVTLRMQFQAPPQPGEYRFKMHLVSDSYIGFDEQRDVIMVIDDASKAQEVDSDDDISEPEEDSIAGQMAALKGQPTADPNKPKRVRQAKKIEDDVESDYESGTDEDEDTESETDTDTDTDGE